MKTLKEIEKEFEECAQSIMSEKEVEQFYRQAIAEILEEVAKEVSETKQKAVKAAIFVGKNGTNSGPIAQARIDGFNCAVAEIREKIKKIFEVKE